MTAWVFEVTIALLCLCCGTFSAITPGVLMLLAMAKPEGGD